MLKTSISKHLTKNITKNFTTNISSKSIFGHIPFRPSDEIVFLGDQFAKDKDPRKVNLIRGVYKDGEGKSFKLNSIKAAHKIYLERNYDHEYTPIEGNHSLVKNALKLAYGENKFLNDGRIIGLQSLSGTGSIKLGLDFMKNARKEDLPSMVYVSDPSWPLHKNVVETSGFEHREYRYFDRAIKNFNLQYMLDDIRNAPCGSIILLHASAQNPSGSDPSPQQWRRIFEVIVERNHFPFFDMAYQVSFVKCICICICIYL